MSSTSISMSLGKPVVQNLQQKQRKMEMRNFLGIKTEYFFIIVIEVSVS